MTKTHSRDWAVWLVMGAMLSAVLLSGCAGLRGVTSEVSSFGSWPNGRPPGRYAFERLPSQQQQAAQQAQVEAAAAPALALAGFTLAESPDQADVSVQVALLVRSVASPWVDHWGMFGPYGQYGPYGNYGPVVGQGSHAQISIGGGWGGHVGGAFAWSMQAPVTEVQVDVLIRDQRSHQVLYETHAVRQQNGGLNPRVLAPMFEAALKDFPLAAISPRLVTIMPPDGR